MAVALYVIFVYCCFELCVKGDMLRRNAILSLEREMSDLLLFLALFKFDL